MKLGIVGLPNVGKSTLFNCLTRGGALAANYPFATIDPNVGIAVVPDYRLAWLTELYQSEKTINAVIEFVDIAGLVKGASAGEGLGNKFLSHIREVDAIIHVVRLFDDENVVHVDGNVNPLRDIETINLELIFSDIEIIEKRIVKTLKAAKTDKTLSKELEILEMVKNCLLEGKNARNIEFNSPEEEELVNGIGLLSRKPVIYAANLKEEEIIDNSNKYYDEVESFAKAEGSGIFSICAKIEEEIAQLSDDEKHIFLEELGLSRSGLDNLITASYDLLGLISFLTAGPKETKAWTITRGTKAPQAAGKIHTDFEKGFIRAEIVGYDDLKRLGSYTAAKEAGVVRLEGKEYQMCDGDVTLFRFNV